MTKKILIDEAVVKQAIWTLERLGEASDTDVSPKKWYEARGWPTLEALEAVIADQKVAQANNKGVNALAEQSAAEPVAWISEVRCVGPEYGKKRYGALPIQSLQPGYYAHTPLYASPQPSKPLTDDDLRNVLRNTNHMIRNAMYGTFWPELAQACRAIEAAHGITGSKT